MPQNRPCVFLSNKRQSREPCKCHTWWVNIGDISPIGHLIHIAAAALVEFLCNFFNFSVFYQAPRGVLRPTRWLCLSLFHCRSLSLWLINARAEQIKMQFKRLPSACLVCMCSLPASPHRALLKPKPKPEPAPELPLCHGKRSFCLSANVG